MIFKIAKGQLNKRHVHRKQTSKTLETENRQNENHSNALGIKIK
jgi:hypothetical protein